VTVPSSEFRVPNEAAAGVERFQDLVAWQKARTLVARVYRLTRGELGKDFGLSSQMQRAAVSVMSNIAEGFERRRPTEFHQYLTVAKASCAELQSLLYVCSDVGYFSETERDELLDQAAEVSRIVAGLRAYVAGERTNRSFR
jgi:four helix bundle protein